MLPPDQIEQIKKDLFAQVENFPPEKREAAQQQIQAMNAEQLEQFLIQNNLIKSPDQEQKCIFCSIIFGDIPTNKIDETGEAIATLEINPISKGHTLVIPKKHIPSSEKLPKTIFTFAEKIAEKLKSKLKPKDITIASTNLFGHEIINVLPIYENENLGSQRQKSKPEKLQELQKTLIESAPKEEEKKISKPNLEQLNTKKIWLPKRIP